MSDLPGRKPQKMFFSRCGSYYKNVYTSCFLRFVLQVSVKSTTKYSSLLTGHKIIYFCRTPISSENSEDPTRQQVTTRPGSYARAWPEILPDVVCTSQDT